MGAHPPRLGSDGEALPPPPQRGFLKAQEDTEGSFTETHSEPLKWMMEKLNYWMGQGLWDYVGKEETLRRLNLGLEKLG